MGDHCSHHLPMQPYMKRSTPQPGICGPASVKKCKLVFLTLTIVVLFSIINLQTIAYIIQKFIIGDSFNVKLCYHHGDHDDSKRSESMPRVIHQMDLVAHPDPAVAELHRSCQATWKDKNPDYTYTLWNSSMIEDLLYRHYTKIRPVYDRYRGNVKVMKNIASYVIVYHMGGVYVDSDLVCKRRLHDLHSQMELATVMLSFTAEPFGISDRMFMANRGHEFMAHVLDGIENGYVLYLAPFAKSTLNTGSAYLSERYVNYPHKEEVFLLPSSSGYIDRLVFEQPWYTKNEAFIAIALRGIDPVELICVILLFVCIVRLASLVRVRRTIYRSHRSAYYDHGMKYEKIHAL